MEALDLSALELLQKAIKRAIFQVDGNAILGVARASLVLEEIIEKEKQLERIKLSEKTKTTEVHPVAPELSKVESKKTKRKRGSKSC